MLYIPDRDIASGAVVDVGTFNSNLLTLLNTMIGGLGQHNFINNAFAGQRTLYADNIGIQVKRMAVASDPQNTATRINLPVVDTWIDIPDISMTIDCLGGTMLLFASIQCHIGTRFGGMSGIKMDGALLNSDIVGSGDLGNDWQLIEDAVFPLQVITEAVGFHGGYIPVTTNATVATTPGKHTFTPALYIPRIISVASAYSQRELIAIEFAR